MHIIHSFKGKEIDDHATGDAAFFITNKKGNYLSLGAANFTHGQGLLFFDQAAWSPYKTIDNIKISQNVKSIKNNLFSAERIYEQGAEESFSLFNNSLYYSLKNYTGEALLELDFRHIFDYDDRGRIYSITEEEDLIIIRYDKYTDHSLSKIERTRYLVIKGAAGFRKVSQWVPRNYCYDAKRKSRADFYIYQALALECNGSLELVMSFSPDLAEARSHAKNIFSDREYFLSSMKKYVTHSFDAEDLAVSIAMKSLDDLLMTIEGPERKVGVFAGYPWFYQFWARDELISLKAFLLAEKFALVKSIVMRYIPTVLEDGTIANRHPQSGVRSIDAAGWLFLRTNEFIEELVRLKQVNHYLSVSELITIKQNLEKSIQGLAHFSSVDGLISGNAQESWMDTGTVGRSGAFIEVQALFLAMMKMHNNLARVTKSKQIFKGIEKEYRDKVRKNFLRDGILLDAVGGSDVQMRPNCFLAYYAYPELLSNEEWKQVFDNALKALWLDWGGLTTVSQLSPLFKPEYTGEDDLSYHNGDSWFYVNNYAAIAMQRLDAKYYEKYIKRIEHASREELLFSGFVGCSAELSSAKALRSEGCLSQAWSLASYLELLYELI